MTEKPLKEQPKNHDEKHAKAQAEVKPEKGPDKLGSLSPDSDAGRVILEAATRPAKPGDALSAGGVEGTGHSTLHVTGAPQVAEKAFPKAKPAAGQAKIGTIVTYRESDYEVSAEGGGTNPEGTNGTREHPAIVTRVWSPECVNLQVFFDANHVMPRSSVMKEGQSSDDAPEGVQVVGGNACWF